MKDDVDSIIDALYVPQMLQNGFIEKRGRTNALLFTPKKELGTGSSLVRPAGKGLAISAADFSLRVPLDLVWKQPEYFLIGFQRGTQAGVLGHIGQNDIYKAHFGAGFHNCGVSVCFLPGFFDMFLAERHGVSRHTLRAALLALNSGTPPPDAVVMLRQIGAAAFSADTGDARLEAKALELITAVLDWHGQQLGAVETRPPTALDRAGIAEALCHIESHCAEPLSLETLAKTAAMSVSKFTACFRRQTGLSAGAYLNRLRMEKAAGLLKTTGAPVSEISAASGYRCPASFSAAFQAQFGLTPSAFRRWTVD